MAGFVRNLLREARMALNYQGWRIRTPFGEEDDEGERERPNFLRAGDAPTPVGFGDEAFGGFCVQGGFVFRLDIPELAGTGSADANRSAIMGIVSASSITDPYEDEAVYHITSNDNTYIRRDEGVLATAFYVYVLANLSNNRQVIWQIDKGTHIVRQIWNEAGSINDTGLLYDHDTEKVYIIDAHTQTLASFGTQWSRVRYGLLREVDEEAGTSEPVLSAGGGDIALLMEGNTGFNSGQTSTDRQHIAVGGVWYARNGVAWNSWLVRSRISLRRHYWLGVAGWKWGDLVAFQNNGTTSTQLIDLVRGTANPEVEVGSDIRWVYNLFDTPTYSWWRIFQFCLDAEGVGWFSYLFANENRDTLNEEVGSSTILSTRLARYDFTASQPYLITSTAYRWGEPGGYNLEYTKPSSAPATQQDIGLVVCQRQTGSDFRAERGTYSVVGLPANSGISFDGGPDTHGRFYVAPSDYNTLASGVYDVQVQYTDEFGSSSIQARITIFLAGQGDAEPAPVWVGLPYDADLIVGTSERTRIFQVEAVGADSYRFGTTGNPQNLFDISAVSGEIFWRGTREVAATDTNFGLVVEAVNEGPTTAEDVSTIAVIIVAVREEGALDYVAPSWNTHWVPVGYLRVGTEIRNSGDFTDGYYHTIDLSNGITPGSVPLSQFRYDVVVGDTSIADAVWYEGSPIISFVGLASGTTTFSVRVSDGEGAELALVVFRISWVLPSLTATSLRWVQGHGQTAPATSLSIPVMEGSTRREVLTSGSQQLYVDVGARSRDLNVFVEDGADIVSVELGAEVSWSNRFYRRVKVFTSGTSLDYEEATTRSVRLSASTSQEHISDVDYSAATSDLPITINVGDLPLDSATPFVGYVPFQVNPGWRPLPVSPSDWVQFGAHTWLRNSETGAGSVSVDLSQSVIPGTNPTTFSVNVIRPDLGRAVLSGSTIVMNGQHSGSVTYQVSATDGTTTRRVVDLNINYTAQTSNNTELRVLRGNSTFPAGLNISIPAGSANTEYGAGEFSVVMMGYNSRNIRLDTTTGPSFRAEVGTEDVTEGTRTGKRIHLYTDGGLISEGDIVTGTLTASVDTTTIGDVRWSADSQSAPITLTGTAPAEQATRFRFFGGQTRREIDAVVFSTITENQAEAEVSFGHGGALYVWCSELDAPRVISVASDRDNVRAEITPLTEDIGFNVDGTPNVVLRVHRVRVFVSGVGEVSPDLHPGTLTFTTPAINLEGTEWSAGSRGLGFSGDVLPDFG